ncbi:MAG: three-Cys-motif partner protein TcmP [Armatimonadetes bacterium]|nr:three-Cys-motif partner protein TcmP [Armatimonadota bacterium]
MSTDSFFERQREHSRIKAEIVSKYLPAWANVMKGRARGPLNYLDLFAGPGYYEDRRPSTPILAVQAIAARDDLASLVRTVFNEKIPARAQALRQALDALPEAARLRYRPQVFHGETNAELAEVLRNTALAPTLAFIDPCGYKGLTRVLVLAILKNWGSECIFFLNFDAVRRALQNLTVEPHMQALFGTERAARLRELLPCLSPREQEPTVLRHLEAAMKEVGAQYVLPFRLRVTEPQRRLYHVVFVTKNALGLKIMKGVMWSVSTDLAAGIGSYEYAAEDERCPSLFEPITPVDDLAPELLRYFAGQTISVGQVFQEHQTRSPYIEKHYKTALLGLEAEGKITVIVPEGKRRRANTFPDWLVVQFPPQES